MNIMNIDCEHLLFLFWLQWHQCWTRRSRPILSASSADKGDWPCCGSAHSAPPTAPSPRHQAVLVMSFHWAQSCWVYVALCHGDPSDTFSCSVFSCDMQPECLSLLNVFGLFSYPGDIPLSFECQRFSVRHIVMVSWGDQQTVWSLDTRWTDMCIFFFQSTVVYRSPSSNTLVSVNLNNSKVHTCVIFTMLLLWF